MKLAPLRAVGRIAWRQARRSPWRSILVVVTIALPIAGLSLAATSIRTSFRSPEERVAQAMGSADLKAWPSTSVSSEVIQAVLPDGAVVVEERSKYVETILSGSFTQAFLTELSVPIDRPPAAPMFALLSGTAPVRAGEVALHPDLLEAAGVGIGDEFQLGDLELALRVTGTVVFPEELSLPIGVGGPGTLGVVKGTTVGDYLVDLPPDASADAAKAALEEIEPLRGTVLTRQETLRLEGDTRSTATGGAFAAASIGLLATALIAGAAFAVGVRRQLRTLGLVGAVGGEPRHAHATVLLGGVSLGLIGSVVGVVIGVAATYVLRPQLDGFAGRFVGPVEVPILPLVGAIGLGTVASVLAAAGPARSATRLSTLEALAGRTRPPRAPGRLAVIGLAAVGVGAAVTASATASHSEPLLAVGLAVMISGFLVAIPLSVTWVGRLAGVLPMAARLATRDVARNGRRTGAALAAATIALALPVAVSSITLSQEALDRRVSYLAPDQLVIERYGTGQGGDEQVLSELTRALPGSVVVPIRSAAITLDRAGRSRERPVVVQGPEHSDANGTWSVIADLTIGGPDLLRALHAEDGLPALEGGKIVGLGAGSVEGGTVHITVGYRAQTGTELPAVQAGSLAPGAISAYYVVSPERAEELGYHARQPVRRVAQYLLRASGALSAEQIQRAKEIAAQQPGISVRAAGDYEHGAGGLRAAVAAIAVVLALAIVGVVVSLVGAESRRDLAVLVAVGAEPRVRRAVSGARALVLALVAGLLAAPAGFAPVAVFRIAQARGYPIVIPWATLALALIAAPLIAGLSAALLSRQPKAARLLRPLD